MSGKSINFGDKKINKSDLSDIINTSMIFCLFLSGLDQNLILIMSLKK